MCHQGYAPTTVENYRMTRANPQPERDGRANGNALSAYYFFSLAALGFVVGFMPLYLRARGITLSQYGILSALYAIAGAATQIPLGVLSDRLRRRRPLVVLGTAALGGSYLLYGMATTFAEFCALYTLSGVVFFAVSTLTSALIHDWTAGTGGTAAMYGRTRIWGSIGFIASLLVVSAVPSLVSGKNLLPFIAGLFLASGVTILFTVESDTSTPREHARLTGIRRLLGNRNLVLFLAAFLLYRTAESSTMSYLSLYLQLLGGSKSLIALALVVNAVVEIPFMIWVGRASDRIGRRPPLVIAFLTLPLRLFLYSQLRTPYDVFLVQMFHGLTFSFMLVSSMAFVADSSAGDRATGQGLLTMVMATSMAVGPFVGGFVADRTSLSAMYGLFAIVALVGGLIFVTFVRESHPDLAADKFRILLTSGSLPARMIRRTLRAPIVTIAGKD